MSKTLEDVLAGYTGAQISALALKLWKDFGGSQYGEKGLEVYRAGGRKIFFSPPLDKPFPAPRCPITGNVVERLAVQPYSADSASHAAELSGFGHAYDHRWLDRVFEDAGLGLAKATTVYLVRFKGEFFRREAVAWGQASNRKMRLMQARHFWGTFIQAKKDERQMRSTMQLGTVRDNKVLIGVDYGTTRFLSTAPNGCRWDSDHLIGFIDELPAIND